MLLPTHDEVTALGSEAAVLARVAEVVTLPREANAGDCAVLKRKRVLLKQEEVAVV